jgi:hypothetical protein
LPALEAATVALTLHRLYRAGPGGRIDGLAGVDKTPLHVGCRALGGKTSFFQNKFERNGTFLLVSAFRPLQKSFLRQRGASQ